MTTIKTAINLAELFPITAMNELKNLQAESFTNNIIATASIEKTLELMAKQIASASFDVSIPEISVAINPIKHLGNYTNKNWPVIIAITILGVYAGITITIIKEENKRKLKKHY